MKRYITIIALVALGIAGFAYSQSGDGKHGDHKDESHDEHDDHDDEHKKPKNEPGKNPHDDHGEESHDDHDEHDDEHKKNKGQHDHDEHGKKPHDDHGDEPHNEHEEHGEHSDEKGHDEHGEEGVVHLSKSAVERSGIRVAAVEKGSVEGAVEVPAEVQLNPDRMAHVSTLVEGQLLSVDVALGNRVEAQKTKLVSLRSVTLGQARAELSRATALYNVAKKNFDRQEKLSNKGISSQRSFLEAQLALDEAGAEKNAARSRLRVYGIKGGSGPDMELKSPLSGVVLERHATQGEYVTPEDALFIIADLSRVWVIGQVYEQQIASVSQGMKATLTLVAYPSRTWSGTVDFVSASLDESTRTLAVRVELDNPDGFLKPGMFGSLSLSAATGDAPTVVVPETAIQYMENRAVVFVPAGEPGEFKKVPVTTGRSSAGLVEVLGGLEAGSEVVVEGAFILKSELMRGQLGHGHAH